MEDHNSEDSVGPNDSGLQIPLKGSYVLLFSILLVFFDKKQKKSAASTDDEPKIGANKVSDFLLFWIIPYLLNYNHQKVREIVKHHRQVNGHSFAKTVKMSALKIIEEAMSSCQVSPELKKAIQDKYKDFYGTEQLEYEYNLLATRDGEPVILVPKRYKVSKMPAALEDIGTAWRELGDVKLIDEFMNKFIKNKEIQRDFLYSLPLLKSRQGVDYAIVFPDEDTFNEVIKQLENDSCEYFSPPKVTPKGGRSLITPRIGLVKNREKHLAVCFSYLQGNTSQRVAALFRAVGAHYLDHFTLVLLHGLCLNSCDPQCKVGNLYPVSCIKKMLFKGIRPKKEGEVEDFSEGLGRFCRAEFPETYKSWEEAVKEDTKVKNLMSHSGKLIIDPKFERDAPLTVAYSRSSYTKKLSGSVPFGATFARTEKGFSKYQVHAVNTSGCLLSMIKKAGRKNNVGVVLIIKDVCGGSLLPKLPSAINAVVAHFTRAVVVAGLPKVYPSEPDEQDRVEIEVGSSEDDDDDDDDDEQPTTSGLTSSDGSANTSGASPGIAFKEGKPSPLELNRLAGEIASKWITVGLNLGIEQKVLSAIDANGKDKPYEMLLEWSSNSSVLVPSSCTPYRHLYDALCQSRVGFSNLARDFCCKKKT